MKLKKVFAFLLIGAMVFAMTACGGKETPKETTAPETEAVLIHSHEEHDIRKSVLNFYPPFPRGHSSKTAL